MAKFQRIYWKSEFDWDNYVKLYDAYAKSNGNYYLLSSLELIKCANLSKKSKVVDLDSDLALLAGKISVGEKLPMADSIIYATALLYDATLWTQDEDFKGLENVKYFTKK